MARRDKHDSCRPFFDFSSLLARLLGRNKTTRDADARDQRRRLVRKETTLSLPYQRLLDHFQEHDFHYHDDAEKEMVRADFRGDVGSYRILAFVEADQDLFQVIGFAPNDVPPGARPAVAEALTRANYGLKIGKFEMDYEDGELRFQAASVLVNDDLPDPIIARLIGTTLAMLDRYLPAFLSVVYGNETPEDAIRFAEADTQSEEDSSHTDLEDD